MRGATQAAHPQPAVTRVRPPAWQRARCAAWGGRGGGREGVRAHSLVVKSCVRGGGAQLGTRGGTAVCVPICLPAHSHAHARDAPPSSREPPNMPPGARPPTVLTRPIPQFGALFVFTLFLFTCHDV